MIKDLENRQNVLYNLIKNAATNNSFSHAYLFEFNNEIFFENIITFVKFILCPKRDIDNFGNNCENCNICRYIDLNSYDDLKIIDPVNGIIRKQQITFLQNDFSNKSLNDGYRVYIIRNCDKMNLSASNGILKFLEEPNDKIIAILTTNNVKKLLPTIVSRCQYIKINDYIKYKDNSIDNLKMLLSVNYDDEKFSELVCDIMKLVKSIHYDGINTVIYLKDLWGNHYGTSGDNIREDNTILISVLIYFYYDVLKILCKLDDELCFASNVDVLHEIAENSNVDDIVDKLIILFKAKDDIRFNVNLNLFLDKLIIDLCGRNL